MFEKVLKELEKRNSVVWIYPKNVRGWRDYIMYSYISNNWNVYSINFTIDQIDHIVVYQENSEIYLK
jgi:hypothetical protein